jgi:integrase
LDFLGRALDLELRMAEHKFRFTEHKLKSLPLPAKGRARYFDEAVAGHCVRVTSEGTLTFGICKWHSPSGKTIEVTIGRWPDISISESRRIATEKIAEIVKGGNPNAEKQRFREEQTFGELYQQIRKSDFKNLKSVKNYDRLYELHLSKWARKRLSEIRSPLVRSLHAEIGANSGKHQANRVLELISSLFSKALRDGFEGSNPAKTVQPFPEIARDRFVQPSEAESLFKAILAEPNGTMRDYFLISLYTGARRQNVLSMRWDDINLAERTWRISNTKNGQPQTVPLAPQALQVLHSRMGNESEFVFHSSGSRSGHIQEPKAAWQRILTEAKLKDLRIHDLRRTFGSWQAMHGASLQIVGRSLNHKSVAATQIYSRINLDPVRVSVERAIDELVNAAGIAELPHMTESMAKQKAQS